MWLKNWDRINKSIGLLFLIIITSTGCSSHESEEVDNRLNAIMLKKIELQYKIWQKTPYRYGGSSLKGTDCSGLVKNFYQTKLGKSLPRSALEQAKIGKSVKKLQAGDLVFFKTNSSASGLHVGIYYKKGLFLHTSSKYGVQYSNLRETYWRSHYWKAKRLFE